MRSIKTLLPLLACLAVAACDNSSTNVTTDKLRSMNEPSSAFIPSDQQIDTKSIGNKLVKMLSCEEPTSTTRLDTKEYGVSFQKITRSQTDGEMNSPVVIRVDEESYSTKNQGDTFKIGYKLAKLEVNGKSSLVQGPYAFVKHCTTGEDCDKPENRVFIQGSPWTKIQTEKNHYKNIAMQTDYTNIYSCSFIPARDDDDKIIEAQEFVQQGNMSIGGAARRAIQKVRTQNGDIKCNGEIIGTGSTMSREIILADELPQLRTANMGDGCYRNTVYSSTSTSLGAKVIFGSSTEIANYTVYGTIQSLDEWKKAKENIANTLTQLETAVDSADSKRLAAETRHSDAKAETKRLELKASDLDGIADASEATATVSEATAAASEKIVTDAGADATDAQKSKAQADRQKATQDRAKATQDRSNSDAAAQVAADARIAEQSALEAFNLAKQNLEAAKQNLANFKAQNPDAKSAE